MILAATLFAVQVGHALAQWDYPSRPVRIIVPSEAGGGTDTSARVLAEKLSQQTGKQFVVENRPGAAQMIGIEAVSRAPADGYTLLVAASPITINPAIHDNVRYDVLKDFAPISQLISVPSVLVVNPKLQINSLVEFVAAAKAKPGEMNYGSAGTGTLPHMAMELLKSMAGIDLQHIPYKGVAPALTDVLGGRTAAMFVNLISAKPHADAGTLRMLANSAPQRSPALSQVPTVAEMGVPKYEAMQWFGLFAPAGTPSAVLAFIHKETATALQSEEMKKRLAADGADAIGNTPADFSAQVRAELAKWAELARVAKLK